LPAAPEDPPLLELDGLVRRFGGVAAVDGVSFALSGRPIAGLIGPNGAGKTTLFNLVAGALRPSAGRILLEGRRIDGLTPDRILRLGLGRTFQIARPFPTMSVLENVMLAGQHQSGERIIVNWIARRKIAGEERRLRDRAMGWIAFLGLERHAQAPARILSGGQRKLLELARVLVAEPRLILLDEPGAGVNPALLETIVERLGRLNRDGIAFLIIEHNLDLVMSLCDPVVVMAEGRLLTRGSAAQVRADPRVTAAWLGHAA
jgi:branched-chain amino acid transport system ATP-binding protein